MARTETFFRTVLFAVLTGCALWLLPTSAATATTPVLTGVPGARMSLPPSELTSPAAAGYDYFGWSVALSGDTAIVGARGTQVAGRADQGAAYVFVRSGGAWTLQDTLTASDGAAGDRFGYSVALSGDTAVIGADVAGAADQGAVYVFTRTGADWTEQKEISTDDGGLYPRFGAAVALSGGTLLVGAPWSDVSSAVDQGLAHVFTGSGASWSPQGSLQAAAGAAGDGFGGSVALDADTALVGADLGGASDRGAAFVFTRSGAAWTERATLAASDGAAQDQFGVSVALSAGTAVVGAQNADAGASTIAGAAYVFTGSGAAWTRQAKLTAPSSAYLGCSVAVDGDTVMAGASQDVVDGEARGAAYAFARSGSTWVRLGRLTAPDARPNDRVGYAVSLSGDTALVGAPAEWLDGHAHLFTGVRLTAPARPAGVSPKGLMSSRTPTLRWKAAARAVTYEVRVRNGSRVQARRPGLTGTTWRCGTRLPRGVWLTWQVRGVNAAGPGAWSAALRIKVR